MGRGIATCNITKKYVLSKVSQITIFSVYFDIPIEQIQHCIETGNTICSPIREDKHPTCGFAYNNNGKLKMRDFAGSFWGIVLMLSHLFFQQLNKNHIMYLIKKILWRY